MDENTNQQPTTPLGNERRDNPGQTKIIENANGDSITPGMPEWTDDTSLEDIAKQYTGIGGKYNDLVENAADNVGDRQVQLVGNDFGATNPYMFNTYYEPAATSFASEMRKQGTQRAVEVGLDRAEKEAKKNAEDAQNRYNNAVAAAKAREEQRRKAQMHISETDMSKLPEGVTEQEILNYYKTGKMSEKEVRDKYTTAGTKQIQDKTNVDINWHALDKKGNNMRLPVSADTKHRFGITDEQWAKMSKKERDAFWAREDVGNYWTRLYMVNYFKEFYGEKAGSNMAKSFNDLNERVDNVVKAVKSNDLDSLKTIDVDFAGVQINFTPDQEVEKIKKAIQETDKLSDSEKQKYIKTIEAKRLSGGGTNAFMQMWHEIESKQVRMESNRQLETWDPDHKWLKNGMQVDGTTYDDVWEIMKLFAETEENMGMSIGGSKSGILHYADVEPDSKQVYSHTSGTLMGTADSKQLNNVMTEVFGIDVDSWKKMAKLESERPEDYEFLRDHASFVMAGGAGSFEQVEDGDKKYFINGKYWSANDENSPISVGDFIFHTIDGTVNSQGEYSDPQLKEFINDYKKIYSGDLEASEENIKKLEANYNAYANRVARAMFLSNNYGTSVNENLYNVILALDGVSDDKLEFVNPNNPNEKMSVSAIKEWFNSLSDDAKYNAYTTISRKARESRGVMILSDDKTGQLYDAGITQNGKNTIGKYNEKDSSSNMRAANKLEQLSNEDCLALAFYIDNGIKNGTISNSFMDNEGVDLPDSFFNGIFNGLKGAAQFFGSVAALGVGSLMPKDEEGLNDVMRWGGEVWKDMTTMSESDDWMHWSGQSAMNPYTQQVREQQRGNLNHMIDTTFNLDYFNVENTVDPNTGEVKDKNGNVISLDNTHYNHMDQGKAFFTGAAGMGGAIAEFVLETAATSGMGKLLKVGAKGTSSLIRKGARAVATKSPAAASVIRASSKFVKTTAKFFTTPVSRTAMQSALQASHAASYLDDVARQYGDDLVKGIADGEIKTAKDVIDTVGKTTKAANAAKGYADDAARATLKEAEKTAVDGLKNYADDAIEAVKKGETMVDDLAKGVAEQADDVSRKLTKKEAQTLLDNVKKSVPKIQNDYAIRYGLDVVADNVDDAARSLSQRILDKLDKALTNAHVFKGVNDSVRTLLKDNLVDAVSRAAVNGRLAAKTGMSVSRIANLSDDAASVLYGMLRASESSADDVTQYALRGVSRMQAASSDVVLKNVDFKKAAQKVVEASERLAVKGGELGLDDVFRLIATEGSVNPGDLLKVLKRSDFVKDRIADWSRDIAQNYWTPELDEHFESHYVDFDTYLHSPEQWLWGAGFDLGVTGLTRLKNHGKLKFYESRIDKILGDVDLSTANKADRAKFRKQMVKLDNLRAKASKLNGKILDRKVSFEQVHNVADKAERAIKDQVDLMSSHVDIVETSDLIKMHSEDAIDEAKAVLAKGGFGSKRKYKQILADADQFNRMIVRGNDKLAMVQEASQALQQVSITRYLDIDTHSKTIHKLNGQQWGKTMSLAWKEITGENFAAKYGRTLGLKEDALGKAFDSRHTINFKDPAKTKEAYAAGQTLVYDTIFKKVRKVMGNSLTKSEYADLRIELNGIRDRMIAAGNQMIDDGRKVRWNYMPTQALTWESEPGSMSAVRALWGWDYKGGIHMTPAGEIANPLLARDQWDFSNIINDFDNGQNTFKRKKGDREIELEKAKNPGATIDEFKDVNYNWAGFDPAYACNAYLNSIDSARIIQPLLDPINGIVIKNPEMAKKVLHTSNVVLDNELVAIEKKYKERVDKEISKRSKAKAGRTSKASLERRATLITDLSGKKGIEKFTKPDVGNKVSAAQAKIDKATMQIRDKIYNSPAISALESMYSSRPELEGLSPEARKAYVVGKLNIAYTELGNDIAAVRSMYTDGGKIKKAYLDGDGNIKPQYTDVIGNLVPDAGTSGTYGNTYGTQYRTFVNQLAQNKSIKAEAFADNNARNIRFSDGSSINTNAFEKHIYNVLATKQAIDLGARVDYFRTKLSPKEMTQLSISKRLQPIDLDSDNARYTLTKEARNILSTFYGDWDNYTNSYTIKNGSAKDKFFQNAISNAFDEAEANGGEINTYDFVQLVDKHIPDFIKDAGRNNDVNVKDFFESMSLLRTYENSGGTTESLLRDLDNALYAEKSADKPDTGKIKALSDTIAVINGTYDFDQRTTNRASFNESLDFEIDESDFGDDSKLTVGDVTADANTSGQVEGFSNLYIPKGVDENLIGGTNELAPEVDLEAYPNMKNAPGQSAGTFEASTAGHKEFSALNAKFAAGTKIMGIDISGKTIEDVYQNTLKGSGKNKAPAADSILGKATAEAEKKAGRALTKAEKESISQRYYDRLWDIWGEQNPELKAQIENLPAGTKITDQFAKTGVSQANSLQRWVKSAQGQSELATIKFSHLDDKRPDNLRVVLMDDSKTVNKAKSTDGNILHTMARNKGDGTIEFHPKKFMEHYENVKSGKSGWNMSGDKKAKDVVAEVSKSPEDMLTWTLLHERGHDAPGGYGAELKYSGEGGKEAAANNWAYEKFFDKTSPDYIAAHDAAVKIIGNMNSASANTVNPPVQTSAPRNIGTSIKKALDILHANTESDYGSKQATRNTKRNAFDSLKKEFDAIANKLDKAADGNKIYRGNDILLGASDNQYLAFANGDHNTPWLGNENPGGVDNYTARQALIAGRDRSGGRSFGNIDFWTPEKINDFIKKNGITVDPQLQEQLDNYKVSYAEKSAIVNDPSARGRVSDAKLSLQNSVPEYLASFNSTVDVDGNTKQAKSSFDLNQRSKYKSDSLNYHSEGERYKLGDQRVVREANKASRQLSNQSFSANDAVYGGLDDPNTLYDWEGTETVAAVNAEIDAAGDEVIEAALQKDKEYQELLAWRNKEASNKKVDKNKIKEIDEFIAARRNEVISNVEDDVEFARIDAMNDIENRGEKVEFVHGEAIPVKSSRKDKSAPTSLDDYEYDNGDVTPLFTARDEGVNNTPYISFVNASKNYNISESLADLNNEFYGNGDKDGFIDARNKLNKQLDDEMASVAMMFDTDVSAKITALKELDGAKDGEVADILKKAKQQANDIEDETVRKYVIKRLDDEIKFAEDNLELTEKTKDKIAKAIAERDPEYRAALEAKRQSNMKPTGSQISAAVPNGSNPVFVNGNMTPDGHITLQQLVDARNEMKLSRKNGKNTLKSSVETKKVLNAMRKEMEYNGSTLITEGPARRQDTWILNLYKRIYDSAGAPLPKIPTFEDLENGFMEYKGKKIKLDLKLSEIYIDPKIASLGHTYWGEGNVGLIEKFYKAATAVSSFNKTIQDIQLAGGLGQYNAFTLRNAITMMWQDPIGGTRALFTNFRNARSNESVVQFYLKNHEKLLKMAIDTGDYSALNAFTNVINARDEVTGGSAIAELGHTIMDMPENIKKEGVIAGLWDTTSNTYKAIFNNPTFVRWAAIAKADMQLRNYDHATRFVNRIMAQYGLKDEDFANMEGGMGTKDKYIAHLAQMRTDRYWTPSKFITSGGNADKYLQKQKRLSIQQTADSLRGMPQKKTLRQCLSDFFFAIGYKLQMNAHPVVGIGSIFTALPNNIRASNAIRNRTSFSVMTSRFAGRGDRNEALVIIGIAALAHAWNTHIGAPSAFEELFGDHGDEENGTHGIAQSLMNFQDFGKFWMPNTKDGRFDPTQRGASLDPFFSIFTLQNSAMRAANKAFFPNQIPINTQRVFYQEDNQNLITRLQGVSDELIGANLLSGYKAIYEFLNNSTYFGNNIWERKRLPDGSENPNYNPLRNLMASVAHIMNLEEVMLGDTTNRWVKGLDIDTKTWKDGEQVDPYSVGPKIGEAGKYNGRTGTVAGSGIIQHEYLSALKKANDGEYFDALTESMELPFKTRNYASRARTQLNTEVIAALRNAKKEYDNKVKSASPEEKDKAYAEFAKKAVNIMHDWSAKNDYALGPNDELTSAATKILVSFMADEYDDVTNRVQNRYDKIKQELKMADGDQFLFSKEAMEAAIADGMSDSEAAELHNKHLTALKEAQIKEYEARQALIKAKIDPNVFDTVDYINDDASAKSASFDKKTYTEILGKLEAPIGEFKNYKEMKAYYEARISEATTTKQKAKLANMYNEQVLDVITPYIEAGYGAAAFNNIYWDGDNLSNKLGPYIILPADKYYGGKYPRTSYLKDMLGIGYRDSRNLPSDKQVEEQLHKVAVSLSKGNISSASALVDNALVQLRKGYWHAAPADYEKLIRMRALLSSRSK